MMQLNEVTAVTGRKVKETVRSRVYGVWIVLALSMFLMTLSSSSSALQDPRDGGPRVDSPQQGYPQTQGAPQNNAPQAEDQNGYPQDDGVPDPPSAGGQQPNYPQNGGPSPRRDDGAQFPAAKSEVARVSLLHGEISMQRGDTGDWSTAALNSPLVRGDQVATGEKSRAEIQLDYANILRLSSRSQAKIADLTRTRIQLQIAQGYASYSIFKGGEADVEIDTPNVSIHPLRNGRYRVQVNSDSETDVIVREGEAEVTTPQGSTTVKKGQQITVRGINNPEYRVDGAPSKDDWDRFNNDRDNQIRDAASWQRTNPYYTGAGDLDGHGRWVFVAGYGWVWQPYQDINWAPYQSGRWVYEPYWGWTWVSYEPWGWAPYHYGRWFCWGGSWVWWPGPVYASYRPIWAPAYVSFIGFGRGVGVGVGFGFGSIGWLPIGPHDYFYPWYGRGFNRVTVVNITNINVRNGGFAPLAVRGRQPFISNTNLALTNPRVRAGISGVPAAEFGRGNVQVSRLNVRETDLRESRVVTGNVPVVPSRESLRVGSETRVGQGGFQPRSNERFFTRNQPPAAAPAFHEQVSQVQRVMQGRAVNSQERGGEINNQQGRSAAGSAGSSVTPAQGREASGGSRGFGIGGNSERSAGTGNAGTGNSGTPQNSNVRNEGSTRSNGGWTKFGGGSGRIGDSGRSTSSPSGPPSREGMSRENIGIPRGGNAPNGRSTSGPGATTSAPSSEDHGGFRKFPAGGNGGGNTQPESSPRNETPRGGAPAGPSGGNVDRNSGGWQRFPSNSGSGSGRSSGPPSKPTLELNKPIVTPRESPSPSRVPDMRNDRGAQPSSTPRGSDPRGGSFGGGRERGSGGGGGNSSHERGKESGGDKGSKSSSRNR